MHRCIKLHHLLKANSERSEAVGRGGALGVVFCKSGQKRDQSVCLSLPPSKAPQFWFVIPPNFGNFAIFSGNLWYVVHDGWNRWMDLFFWPHLAKHHTQSPRLRLCSWLRFSRKKASILVRNLRFFCQMPPEGRRFFFVGKYENSGQNNRKYDQHTWDADRSEAKKQ